MAPVWIAVIAVGAQAAGLLQTAGSVLIGIDQSVTAIVDLHKYVPQVGTMLHSHKATSPSLKKPHKKSPTK